MDLVAGNTIILQYPPDLVELSLSQSDLLSFESVGTIMTVSDLIFGAWLLCVFIARPVIKHMHMAYEESEDIMDEYDMGISDPFYTEGDDLQDSDIVVLKEMGVLDSVHLDGT